MKMINLSLLCVVLFFSQLSNAAQLQITLPEPEWVLGPAGAPLSQREARLQPSEQAFSNALWPLLDEKDYQAALELVELPEDEENPYQFFSPAINYLLGHIYLGLEDTEKSEAAYLEALRQMPDFVRAHQAIGFLYLSQEQYEQALPHFSRAASLGGLNAELFGQLGYLNQQVDNYWGAISAYQQAMMLEYDNPQWQQGLLHGLIQAEQFQSAITLIEALLTKHENDAELWLYKAHAALQMDDNATALSSLEIAIRLGEDNIGNQQIVAQLHLQEGSFARATDLLKASFAKQIDYIYLNQSIAWLLQEEQWVYAAELITAVQAQVSSLTSTQQSQLLNHSASIALHESRQADAIAILQQALTINAGNSDALIQLAGIYADAKRYVQAELLYERATAYEASKEQALLAYAQLSINQLNYPKALDLLRQASQLNPEHYTLRENILILENLVSARESANLQ